jgi:hypothetical protein
MALRIFAGTIVALTLASSPALACKGEEIFADDFTEPSSSWSQDKSLSIGGGQARLTVDPKMSRVAFFLDGTFAEFDVCVDITYPQAKNPDGGTWGGVAFWFKDWKSYLAVYTTPAGVWCAERGTPGGARDMKPCRKAESLKTGAGAKNTIRVTAKGTNATVYFNDTRVDTVKVPKTLVTDGVIMLFTGNSEDTPHVWQFSNFILTEAPK